MALQTAVSFKDNELEALRYQLETVGYVEGTFVANDYDDSPVVLTSLDGKDLGTTFPVPVDSAVTAFIEYSVYKDAGTDASVGGLEIVTVFRDGAGNISIEGESSTVENGTDADSTLDYVVDNTNYGIDVTVAGAASSTNYFLARIKLVCVKKGGLPKKYV